MHWQRVMLFSFALLSVFTTTYKTSDHHCHANLVGLILRGVRFLRQCKHVFPMPIMPIELKLN
jgi:hypothetical protein